MADSPIDYSTRGALAFITMTRPARLNAIGDGTTAGVRDAGPRAHGAGDVRVTGLRSGGGAGCAGLWLLETARFVRRWGRALLGDPMATRQAGRPPLIGVARGPWLFLLLDSLRARMRRHKT